MREAIKLAVPPRGFFVPGVTHLYCRPVNLIYSPQLDQDTREPSYCRLAGGSLVFEKIELILRDQQDINSFESFGLNPFFCNSPLVLISIRHSVFFGREDEFIFSANIFNVFLV